VQGFTSPHPPAYLSDITAPVGWAEPAKPNVGTVFLPMLGFTSFSPTYMFSPTCGSLCNPITVVFSGSAQSGCWKQTGSETCIQPHRYRGCRHGV